MSATLPRWRIGISRTSAGVNLVGLRTYWSMIGTGGAWVLFWLCWVGLGVLGLGLEWGLGFGGPSNAGWGWL